ncbi:MAG TPA: PilN domain-containing protein [Candidatus Saccharimonadales bacterium]
MIEFNLLPDVKLEYLKARRLKRLVVSVSIIIGAAALGLFVLLLLFVDVAQKARLSSLTADITSSESQIQGNTNLDKILTIQKQLQTLPAVEASTPVPSKLFGYLSQVTPSKATISSLSVDFTNNSMTVSGSADSLATVNQFVDTLKFSTYSDGSTTGTPAFSTVVLTSFSYSSAASADPAHYSISFNFDPKLFSSTSNVTLVVPQLTTTRSVTSQPNDLFKADTTVKKN